MNSTKSTLLFFAFWIVFLVVIYFAAFWPGYQCDLLKKIDKKWEALGWDDGENAPWVLNHPEVYPPRNLSTLRLLHVIFRHGDRTNVKECLYPNDPYINETYEPYGFGSMTNLGKRRIFEVGRALRYQYNDYLGDYNVDYLTATSSGLSRCRHSLALMLAGLFPPSADFTWMHGFNWQPIQFDVNTGKDNLLGNPRYNCDNWPTIYNESHAHFQEVMTNYSKYFDWLQGFTGFPRNLLSVNMLYHSIVSNLLWGHQLDESLEAIWPEPTTTLTRIFWDSFSHTEDAKRAGAGVLMQTIMQHTKAALMGSHTQKLHLYSGSDFNQIFLLSMLGQDMYDNPPFGAQITIELHSDEGDNYLKFFYRPHLNGAAQELKIPDCASRTKKNETVCMFDDFYKSRLRYNFDASVCSN